MFIAGISQRLLEKMFRPMALALKFIPPEEISAKIILDVTVLDHSPQLHLAKISKSDNNTEKSDSDIYLISVFFDNYKDLYKDIYTEENIEVPKDRPRAVGSVGSEKIMFRKGLKDNGYTNLVWAAEVLHVSDESAFLTLTVKLNRFKTFIHQCLQKALFRVKIRKTGDRISHS